MPSSPGYRSGSWRLETNARNSAQVGLDARREQRRCCAGHLEIAAQAPLDLLARSLGAVQECDACSTINGERHVERNCERQEQPDQQQGVGHPSPQRKPSAADLDLRFFTPGIWWESSSLWFELDVATRIASAVPGVESGRYPRNLIPLAT